MAADAERIRAELEAAHAEALRVHDSPIRSDQLYRTVERIRGSIVRAGLGEEQSVRIDAALGDALRVLRRDDDGREAAKHIQTAMGLLVPRERKPSPFLDDL